MTDVSVAGLGVPDWVYDTLNHDRFDSHFIQVLIAECRPKKSLNGYNAMWMHGQDRERLLLILSQCGGFGPFHIEIVVKVERFI